MYQHFLPRQCSLTMGAQEEGVWPQGSLLWWDDFQSVADSQALTVEWRDDCYCEPKVKRRKIMKEREKERDGGGGRERERERERSLWCWVACIYWIFLIISYNYILTGPASKNSISLIRSDGSRWPVIQYLAERLESKSLTSADLAAADWACPVDSSDNLSISSNPLHI